MRKPANGVISSEFGSRGGSYHFGIDIANKIGTPIFSAWAGVVSYISSGCPPNGYICSSCGGGGGNWIEISHYNGYKTRYMHLNSISVVKGQKVFEGQEIGKMGNSGCSSGSHLHFEIINKQGQKLNPKPFLSQSSKSNFFVWMVLLYFLYNDGLLEL